jgi:hypothetical protein
MRSALGAAAGVLLGLGLFGCTSSSSSLGKRPDRIDGRTIASLPRQPADDPGQAVMRGEAAKAEIAKRSGTGTETVSDGENGVKITTFAYPDGAVGSRSVGPNGTEYEFRLPN